MTPKNILIAAVVFAIIAVIAYFGIQELIKASKMRDLQKQKKLKIDEVAKTPAGPARVKAEAELAQIEKDITALG